MQTVAKRPEEGEREKVTVISPVSSDHNYIRMWLYLICEAE